MSTPRNVKLVRHIGDLDDDGHDSSASPLTVKDEGSNLTTAAASIDFVGSGVTATGTTAVTVTIPGLTAAAVTALGFVGPILTSDTPSTPLVFADLLQNEAQDDFLYADL